MKHTPIQLRHLFPLLKVFLLLALPIYANVPSEINYRGQLLDNAGNPVSGTVSAEVKVYDSQSAGTLLYSESIGNIQVKNGSYAFKFGSASTPNLLNIIPTASESWLEVIINGGALNRQLLVSVPYAMVAQSLGDGSSAEINGAISLSPQSTPPQAQDGKVALYAKPDGKLYIQGLDGEENEVSGGGSTITGSSNVLAVPLNTQIEGAKYLEQGMLKSLSLEKYLHPEITGIFPNGNEWNFNNYVNVDGVIHIFGKYFDTVLNKWVTFHKTFDTQTNAWSTVSSNNRDQRESDLTKNPKVPMNGFCSVYLKGKIYIIGGYKQPVDQAGQYSNYNVLDNVSVYNVQSNTWSAVAPLPEPRTHGKVFVHNGKIHYYNGKRNYTSWSGSRQLPQNMNGRFIFDPESNEWSVDPVSFGEAISDGTYIWHRSGGVFKRYSETETKTFSEYRGNRLLFFNGRILDLGSNGFNSRNLHEFFPDLNKTLSYEFKNFEDTHTTPFGFSNNSSWRVIGDKLYTIFKPREGESLTVSFVNLKEIFESSYDLIYAPHSSANSGTSSSGTPSIIRVSNEEKAPSGYTQIKQESIEWSMVSKSNPGGDVSTQGDLFSINGKLYYDYGAVKYFEENASVWKVLTHSSGGGSKSGKTAIGSKIYYVGGISDGKKFQVFDTVTATTTEGPAIPYAMWEPCVESVNGKIYAFGSRATQYSNDNNKYVLEFDINSNTWTRLTDKILSINAESLVLDDKIYVIGGGNPSSQSRNFFKYSPENDSWESLPSLPVGLLQHSVFTIGGSIYAFGGPGEFFKFSFNEKQWLILRDHPFPNDTFYSLNHSVTIHNGNLWLTGGGRKRNINSNDNYPQAVETYVGELRESLFIKNSENSTSTSTGSSSSTTNNYPANLFMPYGTNGEPVFAEDTYTVPDGKVLITSNFTGYIKIGGAFINDSSHDATYEHTQDIAIIDGGQTFSIYYSDSGIDGGFAGLLFEKKQEIQPVAGGTNYTVPAGKKLFITSSQGGVTLNGVWVNTRRSPIGAIPIIVPAGTDVVIWKNGAYDTPAGFSGYLMDE